MDLILIIGSIARSLDASCLCGKMRYFAKVMRKTLALKIFEFLRSFLSSSLKKRNFLYYTELDVFITAGELFQIQVFEL